MDMNLLLEYRRDFWGNGTLSAKDKRAKLHDVLTTASREYVKLLSINEIEPNLEAPFAFVAGGKRFCEKAFVNLLGLADSTGYKSKAWNQAVQRFKG
jgi:hypothetical protein